MALKNAFRRKIDELQQKEGQSKADRRSSQASSSRESLHRSSTIRDPNPASALIRPSAWFLRALLQPLLKLSAPNGRGMIQVENDDGNALIETAVTLPVLFTFLFCFMELCLAFYSADMISESAREGTRYAMYRGASCPTTANPTCEVTAAQVNAYASGLGWPNIGGGTMTVATTYPNGNEAVGSQVQVKVTYVFRPTMPFVPRNALTMSSTSKMVIVQ